MTSPAPLTPRELDEAIADRDALLAAAGFKPGTLGEGLRRKVILDDIAGMRGEMVRARHAEADHQGDALLWQCHMHDAKGSGNGLLMRVWQQRRQVERENRHLRKLLDQARASLAQPSAAGVVVPDVLEGWEGVVPGGTVVVPRGLAMHWAWRLESMSCADFCGGDSKCFVLGMRRCERKLHASTIEKALSASPGAAASEGDSTDA